MTNPPKSSVIRRVLVGLAWAVTLIALLCAVNAWHARRAWNAYRTAYQAHVASLDLKAYVPKEIPDAENFAAIPLVQHWFDNPQTNWHQPFGQDHFSRVTPPAGVSLFSERVGDQPHFCDLVAWRDAFAVADKEPVTNCVLSGRFDARSRAEAAPAVLEALKDDQPVLDQLCQASTRPRARYPLDYYAEDPWSIRLPHLHMIKGICLRLALKACAELALDQTTNALADVKLALYLADTVRDEPIVISWLVRAVCVKAALGPVWEGLAEHRWSDAQLQELQSLLGHYDFASVWENSLHAERSAAVLTVDLIGRRDLPELREVTDSAGLLVQAARFAPPGWRDQEKLQYCRLFDLEFQGAWDVRARRFSPSQVVSNSAALQDAIGGSLKAALCHRLFARIMLPPLGRTAFAAATAQTATDQATLACALERYRLAHGQFPPELGALKPQYLGALPNDLVTGAPYHYQRDADGRFTLRSVGGADSGVGASLDNGVFNRIMQGFAVKKGDWTWSYPRD